MLLQEYLHLQNGTDVRGVACEGIAGENVTLTEEAAEQIAKAFCVWLISRTGKTTVTVAVGYDSRITARPLCSAVVKGILSTGHNAVVTGLSTTPSMFMLLQDEELDVACQGSIMITASHLPFNRNGLKFFSKQGGLEKADVTEILPCGELPFFGRHRRGKKGAFLSGYLCTLFGGKSTESDGRRGSPFRQENHRRRRKRRRRFFCG